MTIKQIKDDEKWDEFVQSQPFYTFQQSSNWFYFQKKQGRKAWRLALIEEGKIIGGSLVVKIDAKRGTFLLCQHGPFLDWKDKNQKTTFFKKLKEIGAREGAWVLRVGPPLRRTDANKKLFLKNDFKERPGLSHMCTENFSILDITPDKDQLLSDMRKGHRYSIRKAKREGAEVKKEVNLKAAEKFYKIYEKTYKREDFVGFSLDYIKKEFKSFAQDDRAAFFHTVYNDEILASALIIYYGNEGAYHQGASIRKYKKVPSSQILQWNAILEAKERNCSQYNFWGITPPEASEDHPWDGLTFFKQGFGSERFDLIPAFDLPLSWKYKFTRLVDWVRSKKRFN